MQRAALKLTASERTMLEGTWPLDIVLEASRSALEAQNGLDFARHVLLENHLDEVVILRSNKNDLGLSAEQCLPQWFRDSLSKGQVLDFLNAVANESVSKDLKCNMEYVNVNGVQKEAKPEAIRSSSSDSSSSSSRRLSLRDRIEAAAVHASRSPIYCCEMRKKRAERRASVTRHHPCALLGAKRTKTILKRQIADAFGDLARFSLSWDNSDDGIFVGGRGAGKGLHVDQVLWSNVGVNLTGYKLLATWDHGQVSTTLHSEMLDSVFGLKLSELQLRALRYARTVCLLRPGDIFCLSGGVAHATLSVSTELNATAYESFVSLNRDNVRHFLRTGKRCPDPRYRLNSGAMPRDELDDFKDNTIDALDAIFDYPSLDCPPPFTDRTLGRDLLFAAANLVFFLLHRDEFYAQNMPRRIRIAASRVLGKVCSYVDTEGDYDAPIAFETLCKPPSSTSASSEDDTDVARERKRPRVK